MAKAPSEWCSEDHLDVLEERGQKTEDQRTQEVESALCYELCANNGVKVTPGREVGECSPSPYSHLELTPQPLKPLYSVTPGVSNTPELSGLPPFPDGSTTPHYWGWGGRQVSQERHDRAFSAEQQEIKKTAGVTQTLSLSGPLPKETAACSTTGRQSCLC